MKANIIVADASPLIALAKLNQMDLVLQLFSAIHLPKTVYLEVTQNQFRSDAQVLKSFLDENAEIHSDLDNPFVLQTSRMLDAGETQALALAKELGCGVLMDEMRGRKVAMSHGISVIGLLGMLIQAKKQGAINSVAPLIQQLQVFDYRLSDALIHEVLKRVGEL